jgi:phage terminase Nu1 subunit (DNA packaging protein)
VNAAEHFKRAEDLAAAAHAQTYRSIAGDLRAEEHVAALAALAQVHATLALTAATADATAFKRELARANGVEPERQTVDPAAFAAAYLD